MKRKSLSPNVFFSEFEFDDLESYLSSRRRSSLIRERSIAVVLSTRIKIVFFHKVAVNLATQMESLS